MKSTLYMDTGSISQRLVGSEAQANDRDVRSTEPQPAHSTLSTDETSGVEPASLSLAVSLSTQDADLPSLDRDKGPGGSKMLQEHAEAANSRESPCYDGQTHFSNLKSLNQPSPSTMAREQDGELWPTVTTDASMPIDVQTEDARAHGTDETQIERSSRITRDHETLDGSSKCTWKGPDATPPGKLGAARTSRQEPQAVQAGDPAATTVRGVSQRLGLWNNGDDDGGGVAGVTGVGGDGNSWASPAEGSDLSEDRIEAVRSYCREEDPPFIRNNLRRMLEGTLEPLELGDIVNVARR